MTGHFIVGKQGEAIATAYLQAMDYHVRDRNVRLGHDEIDIVAFDPEDRVIVFIEVKARSWASAEFRPENNLTYRKKNAMRRAARRWVAEQNYQGGYRMDVVCIVDGDVVDHFKEISWSDE